MSLRNFTKVGEFDVAPSLASEPECLFVCGDESVTMLPREAWEFNHHKVHSVVNASENPRIHVIADYLR